MEVVLGRGGSKKVVNTTQEKNEIQGRNLMRQSSNRQFMWSNQRSVCTTQIDRLRTNDFVHTDFSLQGLIIGYLQKSVEDDWQCLWLVWPPPHSAHQH